MPEEIILEHISKKYDANWIIKEMNQSFLLGHSYAFTGHNGCGKSTLLKILSGLLAPTEGKVYYPKKLYFSYVPEKFPPIRLSARSYLRRLGEIDRIPPKQLEEKINQLSEDFFLEQMLDLPMRGLSKGTLQKIGVMQTLLKDCDVLLLDEPLSGQDDESQKIFIDKINDLRAKGVTVFMSCHEKWLLEAVCDTVFTFQDKGLIPYASVREPLYLVFVEKTKDTMKPWENMTPYGAGFKIMVPEQKVQETVEKLWKSGWKLKGMYDENNQTGTIPTTGLLERK